MSSLGGKAATELVFGEVDTGVVSDLDSATEMLERFRDFYAAYGFDKRINPFRHFDTTDMVAEQFVAGQLELYYRKTKSILIEHRPFLDALAKELEEKEMLFGSDVRCIRKAVEA